jgi:hypothetical protein
MARTAKVSVAAGAALLDEKRPGWFHLIDLERLHLSSTEQCVLGQLFDESITVARWQTYGFDSLEEAVAEGLWNPETEICVSNFEAGRRLLGLKDREIFEHGFDSENCEYARLDELWAEAVSERQAQSRQDQ